MLPEQTAEWDRFVLEGRAGGGGMGDVYKGVDRTTGQTIAVKLLRSSATAHERARFLREIHVLADLRHPNIVQYVAHGWWDDGRPFLAMEWLDGEDLGQRQRRAPLGMRDAVEVVRRSAAAMAAIHARGVVHRDLKLSNIFLVRGKGTAVKLIDFGVVRLPEPDEHPTERGTIIGTPHFMAPEQARGEPIDARADVYSLGAVLFRLVTGRNVFETEHVIALLGRLVLEDPPRAQSIRFDVPEALDQVIARSVARPREQRFENGGELARALARVGTVNNDPPATDRSASAIRRAMPDSGRTPTGSEARPAPRPGQAERRIVACVLVEVPREALDDETTHDTRTTDVSRGIPPALEQALLDALGDDTRLEPLVGRKLVAVLGIERSQGDEPVRAARAGLITTHAVPGARVAVAIGHAVRSRGNLAGQALERAVQALERARPGEVRVDGAAASVLEGRFVLHHDLPAGAEGAGALLLREDESGFGARLLLGRVTPTVGREKEIALLQGIYQEMLDDGTPRAALVLGPPGIGKSRVCLEVMRRLETARVRPDVLLCRGDPMNRGTSVSALGRSLRQVMGIFDGEPAAQQVDKVRAYVAQRMPRTLRFLAAFLGELTGVHFPDNADEPLRAARASAELMQSRLRMALEAFVRAGTERAPQVLMLEDVRWADDTTLELVDWLLGCPELRFAVFAFARPELSSLRPTLWDRRNVTRLSLAGLAPQAAERLVTTALPALDADKRAAIVRRAGGNALFLEELVRCAAEGRDELPVTVQALVQLRLDRMAPGVREVLRAASVFGQVFWRSGVGQLMGRDVEAELYELSVAEIATREPATRIRGQEQWQFRQALVRDAAYASIVEEDRAELHLEAGAWLESMGDADPALVARHAEAGGDLARAAALYARATRDALTHGAELEAALELAERGLACGAEGGVRAQLLLGKAQIAASMGKLSEATQAADEAATLAPPGSDMWGEAQRLLAASLIESGRAADGDARVVWALRPEISQGLSPPIRATLLSTRVRALVDLNMPTDALEVATTAVETARQTGIMHPYVRALDARLFALMNVGDQSGVIEAGPPVIEAAESIGDALNATRARVNMGSVLNLLGAYEEAQTLLQRALLDARARRMRILEAFSLHNLGMSYARLGALDEGLDYQRQAGRIGDETRAARLRVHARVYEAVILTWRGAPGDLSKARELVRFVVEEARSILPLQVTAAFVSAHVLLARRELEAAVEAARDANQRLAMGPVEEWEEYMRATLVDALYATGRDEEGDAVLDVAFRSLLARARGIRDPRYRHMFLTRHEEVQRIVALAHQRLGRALPPL